MKAANAAESRKRRTNKIQSQRAATVESLSNLLSGDSANTINSDIIYNIALAPMPLSIRKRSTSMDREVVMGFKGHQRISSPHQPWRPVSKHNVQQQQQYTNIPLSENYSNFVGALIATAVASMKDISNFSENDDVATAVAAIGSTSKDHFPYFDSRLKETPISTLSMESDCSLKERSKNKMDILTAAAIHTSSLPNILMKMDGSTATSSSSVTTKMSTPSRVSSSAPEIKLSTAKRRYNKKIKVKTETDLDIDFVPSIVSSSTENVDSVDAALDNSNSKQIRYDPATPMTKEALAAWRKEARRVRNRQSAAASRQKIRNRIEELEEEVNGWKDRYEGVLERLKNLEDGFEDDE